MVLMIVAVITALRKVLNAAGSSTETASAFGIWACACGLFSHAVTGISVSYFDQSMLFFWLNLAVTGSIGAEALQTHPASDPDADADPKGIPEIHNLQLTRS